MRWETSAPNAPMTRLMNRRKPGRDDRMRELAVRGTLDLRSPRTSTSRPTCHALVRRGRERLLRHGTVDASSDGECFTAGASTASWTPSYDSFESAVRHSSFPLFGSCAATWFSWAAAFAVLLGCSGTPIRVMLVHTV
jgi:hypothetical protein